MADTAPDRDGLQLDELQVSLGPVLAGWPTGLVLEGRLQGDVLSGVTLRWADAQSGDDGWTDDTLPVRVVALDQLARVLQVAGWPTAARDARRARNRLSSSDVADAAVHLARRVGRSRTLAWSIRGIGTIEDVGAPDLRGDVLDRVRWWCRLAVAPEPPASALPDMELERLVPMLEGAELTAARLVVASLPLLHPVIRQQPVAAGV